MPPASTEPGPDHSAPSKNVRDITHGRGVEPHGWWVERWAERSPSEAAECAFGWLVAGSVQLSLPGVVRPSLPRRAVPLHHLRTRLAASRVRSRDRDAIWAALILRALMSPSLAARARWTLGCVGAPLPSLVSMAAQLSVRYPGDPADIESAIPSAFMAKLRRISTSTWTGDGVRSCFSAHGQDLDHGRDR